MLYFAKSGVFALCLFLFPLLGAVVAFASSEEGDSLPTHADAVMVIAKYSGLFERYISEGASLNECVAFLNQHGVYFGLLEVLNGSEFSRVDCAKVMGQLNLLFSGEAQFEAGKVKLPSGVASWEEFCILNDVQYAQGYEKLVLTVVFLRDLSR
ncbi:MAG: hypothetical protein JXR25_17200 [Pontiellaceae bacterium]|nr:hypothetical protein [Pontiellaceae bacterium]